MNELKNYGEACWKLTHGERDEQVEVPTSVEAARAIPQSPGMERYYQASTMFPGRPVSPLHYGATSEQVDAHPAWHVIGEDVSFSSDEVAGFMSPEAFAAATSSDIFQALYAILQEQKTQRSQPADQPYAGGSVIPVRSNEAIVVHINKIGAEETIFMFLSDKHLAYHGKRVAEAVPFTAVQAFVLPGLVSRKRAKLEVDKMFPELMYWLTDADQKPVSISGVLEANIPGEDVSLELSSKAPEPLVPSIAAENVPRLEAAERPRHRHRRRQPVMAMLGRVAAGIGKLRRPRMPEQLRGRLAVSGGALGVLAVAGAAYVGYRYLGDGSVHMPFLGNFLASPPSPRGIAEAVNNTTHADVAAHQSFPPPHPPLHPRPPKPFYYIDVGTYNSTSKKGTLSGDAAIELRKQVAHPTQNQFNAAYNKIVAWNTRKLAGLNVNFLPANLSLKIPFNLLG